MKKAIDLPDALMVEVQALATFEKRKVDDVVAEPLRDALTSRSKPHDERTIPQDGEQRMIEWFALADTLMDDTPSGPTAREILDEDRNRSERI